MREKFSFGVGGGGGKLFRTMKVQCQLTLIVEAIDAVDASALVVAAQKKKVFWILDLVGQKQTDRL